MTIVEFFDKTAIENMLSALLCSPDRVVYIGDSSKRMNKCLDYYREVLRARGKDVELTCRGVGKNNLQRIVDVLTELVEQDKDCVFNLDGGEDLYLVAVGMMARQYPGNVQLHRFNVRSNTILDCDADGNDQLSSPIAISIAENVRIYGGAVVTADQHTDGTYPWDFNEDFRKDLHAMWEICCRHQRGWNAQINTLDCVSRLFPQEDGRSFRAVKGTARAAMERTGDRYSMNPAILKALASAGLISGLYMDGDEVEFVFKNEQVRRCLTKAGQALELIVTVAALDAAEDDGSPVYNDVRCGVYIDWDGDVAPEGAVDVANEIDVFLMKGAVPVFISCKNGYLEADELYKLSQVAQRFGDKYAKKVLVATQLDKMGAKGEYIRARAQDMCIRVVDDLDDMTQEQMRRLMKTFWNS